MGPRGPTGGSLVDDSYCHFLFSVREFLAGHIYVIDTKTDPEAPSLHKVVHPEDIVQKTGLAYLHTSHCLASGDFFSLTQSLMSREDENYHNNSIPLWQVTDISIQSKICTNASCHNYLAYQHLTSSLKEELPPSSLINTIH
ncbi:selenium-binding protein 2-like [Rosa chinensis]|uniref:selenium-binding protein 2-like n=1 Tax=Rosa chinensis TaxID=74649 RepID=UPI001AD8D5C7|nr:selenium-binding protein 2-like [Rosa chinensis]